MLDVPAVWLEAGKVKQLVLIVTEADSKEVVERWTFDIDTNKDALKAKGCVQSCMRVCAPHS